MSGYPLHQTLVILTTHETMYPSYQKTGVGVEESLDVHTDANMLDSTCGKNTTTGHSLIQCYLPWILDVSVQPVLYIWMSLEPYADRNSLASQGKQRGCYGCMLCVLGMQPHTQNDLFHNNYFMPYWKTEWNVHCSCQMCPTACVAQVYQNGSNSHSGGHSKSCSASLVSSDKMHGGDLNG